MNPQANQNQNYDMNKSTHGTGLGLAIVKHSVIRHGGKLLIESEEGVGSKFILIFPKKRVEI